MIYSIPDRALGAAKEDRLGEARLVWALGGLEGIIPAPRGGVGGAENGPRAENSMA